MSIQIKRPLSKKADRHAGSEFIAPDEISDILMDMVRVNAHNIFIVSSLSGDVINTFLRGLEEVKPEIGRGGDYARFAGLCDPSDVCSYLDAIQEIRAEVMELIGSKPAAAAKDDAIRRILAFIDDNCENEDHCVSYVAEHFSFDTNRLGKILGTGSDVCDHVAVTSLDRRMRAGLCSAVVKVYDEPGTLRVYARAEGLIPARLYIVVQEAEKQNTL